MTVRSDPDAILAAWIEEGPDVLPESTRRAIAVTTRTIRQSRVPHRLPWRVPNMNGMTRFALAAVAVVAVVFGGLSVLRPATGSGGVGGSGSAAPPTSIPTMTRPFTSSDFGYSIRYPADWHLRDELGPSSGSDFFVGSGDFAGFRVLSVVVPDGVAIDDYIVTTLTNSNVSACIRRPDTLEAVTIDGHEGRVRGFCGEPPATEVEATVVVGRRVYLFTLFWFAETPAPTEAEVRAWFDAFTATITLDPENATSSIATPTQAFESTKWLTSPTFGYSIRYPAAWVKTSNTEGPTSDGSDMFEALGVARFRALSVVVPDGQSIDDFIVGNLTASPDAACSPRPDTLEAVTIDGHEGRVRGFCGEPPVTEIEASVVIGRRVYLFTLFWHAASPAPTEAEVRAWFEAFTATITLDPESAQGAPSPSPS